MSRTIRNQTVVSPENWMKDKNGSIFIKYIPNNITKTDLRAIFSYVGNISRIDIVNIAENGSGRRAFLHFTSWNDENPTSVEFRSTVANMYPTHIDFWSPEYNFTFSLTLNSRPIPTAELNVFQMQDWMQRLNDEFVDYKTNAECQMTHLMNENSELRNVINEMRNDMANMRYAFHFMMQQQEQPTIDVKKTECVLDILYNKEEKEEEMEMFDLDSVEAGVKRERDPLIYQRVVSV
jgi:RNA recognition motif-containing protein